MATVEVGATVEIAHIGGRGGGVLWIACRVTRVDGKGFLWVNDRAAHLGDPATGSVLYADLGKCWRLPESVIAVPDEERSESVSPSPEELLVARQNADWSQLVDRIIQLGVIDEGDRTVAEAVVSAARALHDTHVGQTSMLVLG